MTRGKRVTAYKVHTIHFPILNGKIDISSGLFPSEQDTPCSSKIVGTWADDSNALLVKLLTCECLDNLTSTLLTAETMHSAGIHLSATDALMRMAQG